MPDTNNPFGLLVWIIVFLILVIPAFKLVAAI